MRQKLSYIGFVVVIIVLALALYSCKKRKPENGPQNSTSIRKALIVLLNSVPSGESGGFVIFQGKRDLDYVQYSLDSNGLLLNWPTFQEDGMKRLPHFEACLIKLGYKRILPNDNGLSLPEQINAMKKGQYMILDDGLYGQTGHDAEDLTKLTLYLLSSVFGISDKDKISITLEPDEKPVR